MHSGNQCCRDWCIWGRCIWDKDMEPICLFVHSFVHLFFVCLFLFCSFIHSFVHLLICSFVHSFIHSFFIHTIKDLLQYWNRSCFKNFPPLKLEYFKPFTCDKQIIFIPQLATKASRFQDLYFKGFSLFIRFWLKFTNSNQFKSS